MRDRLAPYLRPDAKVKPKDVPALVESLWRVQTAVQAIAARAATIPGLSVPEGWNPFLDGDLLPIGKPGCGRWGCLIRSAPVRWPRWPDNASDWPSWKHGLRIVATTCLAVSASLRSYPSVFSRWRRKPDCDS